LKPWPRPGSTTRCCAGPRARATDRADGPVPAAS